MLAHAHLRRGRDIASSGGFAAVAVAIALSVRRAREAKKSRSARWATDEEVLAAELLKDDGVVLGRWKHGMIVDGANQLWVADLTYIAIATGFVYLAAILDAWSRRVVGYAISRSIDARLTIAALKAAIHLRQPPAGCVHHSPTRPSRMSPPTFPTLSTRSTILAA